MQGYKKEWISRLLFLLFAMQPLLDVLSYWMQRVPSGSYLTLGLRFSILLFLCALGFLHTTRRRLYCTAAAGFAIFYLLHLLPSILSGGFSTNDILHDFTNYIRVLHLPAMTLALCSLLKADDRGWNAIERGCLVALGFITLIALLSRLTGTDPTSYPNKQLGVLGWFYYANSQSAILSALVPLTLCAAVKRGKWVFPVVTLIGTALLFLLGTRLAYASALAALFGTLISWLLCRKLNVLRSAVLIVCTLLCAAGYFISPMRQNQQLVAQNAEKKQQRIDALVEQGRTEFPDDALAALGPAYEEYLGGLVDRFGLQRVADYYGRSTSASDLCDLRRAKRSYCELLLQNSSFMTRLFGLNYADMEWQGVVYDVENDFHAIRYLYGWVGLGALLLLLGYFVCRIVCALLQDAKGAFTMEVAACGISLCTLMAHCYFTSGVLRRPNASVYLSLVLAGVWYYAGKVRKKQ